MLVWWKLPEPCVGCCTCENKLLQSGAWMNRFKSQIQSFISMTDFLFPFMFWSFDFSTTMSLGRMWFDEVKRVWVWCFCCWFWLPSLWFGEGFLCDWTGVSAEQSSGRLGCSCSPAAAWDHPFFYQADLSKARQGSTNTLYDCILCCWKAFSVVIVHASPHRASSRTWKRTLKSSSWSQDPWCAAIDSL